MKQLKKIVTLILCLALTMGSVPAYAANSPSSSSMGEATINSTLSFQGPLSGARRSGSPKKMSSHDSITTASLAILFLSAVSGVNNNVYSASLPLVTQLVLNSSQNQYYTRTLYYSSDRTMYYFKYDYYKNSNYTGYLGSDYSYVYSVLY